MFQFTEGKCFLWANFLSNPQNTCTISRVAAVTGSEKSPPGGETAPTIEMEPCLFGDPEPVKLLAMDHQTDKVPSLSSVLFLHLVVISLIL
jgi:hypothetical protein